MLLCPLKHGLGWYYQADLPLRVITVLAVLHVEGSVTLHVNTPSGWIGPFDFSVVINETVALRISDDCAHTLERGTVVRFDLGFSLICAW